jgi:hypothetical protein
MGRSAWEAENKVNRYELIEAIEYRKLIEEVAEMVYIDICQLLEDSFIRASNDDLKPLEEAA